MVHFGGENAGQAKARQLRARVLVACGLDQLEIHAALRLGSQQQALGFFGLPKGEGTASRCES
jgi:hypothetical protein